jgi:hypothetical protein
MKDAASRPGYDRILTKTARGLIAAPMNNAATIIVVRRRRAFAVWAVISV